jgi:hypothetical protein
MKKIQLKVSITFDKKPEEIHICNGILTTDVGYKIVYESTADIWMPMSGITSIDIEPVDTLAACPTCSREY